ncbi:MAG: hypothetical protein L6Q37_14595, partial [Bdellovibrionaceae bacterium]|nr:hypothetical protein [Pseudobdellovibrionaceae bacterium]
LNGNICYSSATGQQVATTLCTSTCNSAITGNYYWNGGICYSNLGQVMDSSYCLNNSNLGTISAQCVGEYIYNNAGFEQRVNCYGAICRGYTLIEPTTRRTVICQ